MAHRQLPVHLQITPSDTNNVMQQLHHHKAAQAAATYTTPPTPSHPTTPLPPTTTKKAKISPSWWQCAMAKPHIQAATQADTPEKWDAMVTMCVNQTGTAFFKHHKLTTKSSGAQLKEAVYNQDPNSPLPPPNSSTYCIPTNT